MKNGARKERIQGQPNRKALLAHGRDIRTDSTKSLSTVSRTKTTGYFLLNFEHTNIAFSQIIINWTFDNQLQKKRVKFDKKRNCTKSSVWTSLDTQPN